MIQYLSVTKYFKLISESHDKKGQFNKMEESMSIVGIMFNKESKFSYRAREWADQYYLNGTFLEFKQGKHKNITIITDENVQLKLRNHLRSMSAIKRTPINFMQVRLYHVQNTGARRTHFT